MGGAYLSLVDDAEHEGVGDDEEVWPAGVIGEVGEGVAAAEPEGVVKLDKAPPPVGVRLLHQAELHHLKGNRNNKTFLQRLLGLGRIHQVANTIRIANTR